VEKAPNFIVCTYSPNIVRVIESRRLRREVKYIDLWGALVNLCVLLWIRYGREQEAL
jgi:hypothetical protein